MEHHHFVDAVDELGAEAGFHFGHHRQLDHLVIVASHLLDHLAAEVADHHDDGVLEIGGAPLAIGCGLCRTCNITLYTSRCAFSEG